MSLSYLAINDLRNIEQITLTLNPRLNLIFGPNGSGKSSILEAIYLLGRGKSFRSAYSRRIVRHGQPSLTVFAKSNSADGREHSLGIQIKEGRFRAKINGTFQQKSSDLANILPLLLISPDGDKLIKGSPRQRRRFLDWGLFHVEPGFLQIWQQYNQVLLQRNALLRQRNSALLKPWDKQLVEAGLSLDRFRRDYVSLLAEQTQAYFQELVDIPGVEFKYQAGWSNQESYAEALNESVGSDIRAGFTQRGPHRADLLIQVNGRSAAEYLSGGQQKLAACALILAQAALFNQNNNNRCLLLVDDLAAELDSVRRHAFIELLYSTGGQLFVTSTDEGQINLESYPEKDVFHVEQGGLQVLKGKT